ncbi:MAG: ABC transporter permease [Bacilli bacterium]|nr:ABC transporter permease [Bacilli bacterium]
MEAVVRNKKQHRFNFRGSLCMPYALFMLLFVVFPLLLIVYYAFTDAKGNFSFANWGTVFTNATNWKVIGQTVIIASITTLVCILIAYPVAYLLSNKKYNKNKVLVYIFLLPMWINFVIRTVGLKALINGLSKAILGVDLTATYPYLSIVIGMVYDYLPFAILPLYNQMLKMDKNQIEAAADLGANPFRVFYKVIIPMTIPGIVSACMMTFMPTMSSYVIANKMSENNVRIIGNLIEQQFGSNTSAISNHIGSTLSLVMLIIIGLTLLAEKAFSNKEETKKGGIW